MKMRNGLLRSDFPTTFINIVESDFTTSSLKLNARHISITESTFADDTLNYSSLYYFASVVQLVCARGTLTIDNSVFQNLAHLRIVKAEAVAIHSSNFCGQTFNVGQYYNNIIRRLEVLNSSFYDSDLHVYSTDNALIQQSLFSNESEGITA